MMSESIKGSWKLSGNRKDNQSDDKEEVDNFGKKDCWELSNRKKYPLWD